MNTSQCRPGDRVLMFLELAGDVAYNAKSDLGNGFVIGTILGWQDHSVILGFRKGERCPDRFGYFDLVSLRDKELLKADPLVNKFCFKTDAICFPASNRRVLQ